MTKKHAYIITFYNKTTCFSAYYTVKKRARKFGQGPPPPDSDNARKKTFFLLKVFPNQKKQWEIFIDKFSIKTIQ